MLEKFKEALASYLNPIIKLKELLGKLIDKLLLKIWCKIEVLIIRVSASNTNKSIILSFYSRMERLYDPVKNLEKTSQDIKEILDARIRFIEFYNVMLIELNKVYFFDRSSILVVNDFIEKIRSK